MLNNPEGYDLGILEQERLAIRPDAEAAMRSGIKEQIGAPIQEKVYVDSLKEAENSLTIHESQLSNEQEEMKKNGQKER